MDAAASEAGRRAREGSTKMDIWNSSVVYQLTTERHHEDIRRGEASQLQSARLGAQTVRSQLAQSLVALAARLAPERLATATLGQTRHEQSATA
jgi:hypothetical protein